MPTEELVGAGVLESRSLWYHYKAKVWPENSPQRDVVHNIMRVLRSIRNFKRLAYVSTPITSGKFICELRMSIPSLSGEELLERAMWQNHATAVAFVERLQKRMDCPILFPSDLTPAHQEWEQDHFQALWLSIIAEMCTEVHMAEGWEFSNGGVEEFVHVMQLRLGIPVHRDMLFFNTKGDESVERERMRTSGSMTITEASFPCRTG